MRCTRVGWGRWLRSSGLGIAVGIGVGFGIAPCADADTLYLQYASLRLQVGPLAEVEAVWDGTGAADVSFGGGSNLSSISGLSSSVLGFNAVLSTPESWFPFEQLVLSGANGSGNFTSLDTFAGGGTMPILGGADLCFFGCSNGVGTTTFTVPFGDGFHGWGLDGTPIVSPDDDQHPVIVTVQGSAWTTGSVAVGSGSAGGTPAFGGTVTLVSALGFSWRPNAAGSSVIDAPGYAALTLSFAPVPEPGTLTLVSIALAAVAVRRRNRITR